MNKVLQFLTKELVEQAAKQIDVNGIPPRRGGRGYVVLIDNKKYPFKLLVTEAAKLEGRNMKFNDFSSDIPNRKEFEDITGFKCVNMAITALYNYINSMDYNTYIDLLKYKKQVILQGPPGTGKTYTAKNIAEQMIFGEVTDDKKLQKERLENSEQFELVQFHPSYSYEDFVRGITAKSENGVIFYETQNKVFSLIVEKALNNLLDAKKKLKDRVTRKWIEDMFELYIEFIKKEIPVSSGLAFPLINRYYVAKITSENISLFYDYGDNSVNDEEKYNLSEIRERCIQAVLSNVDVILDQSISNPEIPNIFEKMAVHSFYKKFRDFLRDEFHTGLADYVLVIDEINRANLPSVLGELIYALEYRGQNVKSMYALGGDASIVVPENLYIIGTMNTADRSVGHIDYAIKRRFAFVDVEPSVEVINHKKARELFNLVKALFVIEVENNKRPSEFLASDFDYKDVQLGHSYFMVKSDEELKMKLKYEIVPILHEYVKDGVLIDSAKDEIEKIAGFDC